MVVSAGDYQGAIGIIDMCCLHKAVCGWPTWASVPGHPLKPPGVNNYHFTL